MSTLAWACFLPLKPGQYQLGNTPVREGFLSFQFHPVDHPENPVDPVKEKPANAGPAKGG
jgi:hypothetical protein